MQDRLTQSPKFRRWKSLLEHNGLNIHGITEIFTRFRHDNDPLFSLVMLDATTPEGDKIPPICFLKGEIVSVMLVLIDQDTREKYVLLVKQRRICSGAFIYEQVAGMVDGADKPHEVAVREVAEETGVEVRPEEVIPLNTEPLYCSTGTSDEALYFYYCELERPHSVIQSYHNQQQGVEGEGERIVTHLATIPEALQLITNTNGLLNIYLYQAAMAARG
ncbi:MAG: NUDIX hydrolase [Bacteroidia bacterium]|nr:NUDIX hydrolase [Bacteroidia bacterium]